jgi:hypothetical protein
MRITLPLSGRQGAMVGEEERSGRPVHSKGLFEVSLSLPADLDRLSL